MSTQTEIDNATVDAFAEILKAKLRRSFEKGRSGWHDPAQCSTEQLANDLLQHIGKGDPVDVAVYAMFLWQRVGGADMAKSFDRRLPLTAAQIKHLVDRFLAWRLPENFNPDGGISAERPNYAPEVEWSPSGTNLLDATQAEAMVRHMIEGL